MTPETGIKIMPVLEEIEAFIDRRGTNGLLFEELDELSDAVPGARPGAGSPRRPSGTSLDG